jgi:phosphomannomutase
MRLFGTSGIRRVVAGDLIQLALKVGLAVGKRYSDGIKLNYADGWLLVRASGTEPKIRVTAEAKTEARVRELYHGALEMVRDMMLADGAESKGC